MELNENGRIIMANSGACEIFRQKEANIIGEHLTSLCEPSDKKVLQELIAELAQTSSPEPIRMVIKVGDAEIPVLVSAIVEERRCTGILVITEASEANAGETQGPTCEERGK